MNIQLKKGDIYLFKGPCVIKVGKGKFEIVGKTISEGDEIRIPVGKSVPVEAVEEGELGIEFDRGGEREHLSGSTVPYVFDELVLRLSKGQERSVLVLGETDIGKTFLCTYVANKLVACGKKPGIIDCDTGQSDIGPPGTIGLAILEKQILFPSELEPTAMYFIGSNSPAFHLLYFLVGVEKLVNKGFALADVLLIDTPGWVHGEKARALQQAVLEIVNPDLVVLMQRNGELEHLVRIYSQERVMRITVKAGPVPRSHEERKSFREAMYKRHLEGGAYAEFSLDEVKIDRALLGSGKEITLEELDYLWAERLPGREGVLVVTEKPLSEEEITMVKRQSGAFDIKNIISGNEKNLLVGLLDSQREVLGIGLVDKIDFKKRSIRIFTAVREKQKVGIIQFGSVRLTPSGNEYGIVEPGYL